MIERYVSVYTSMIMMCGARGGCGSEIVETMIGKLGDREARGSSIRTRKQGEARRPPIA